jgi:hypothetical protein
MYEPKRFATIFMTLLACVCLALMVYYPGQGWMVFPGLLFMGSAVSAMFLSIEWMLLVIEHQHRERRYSDSITPTSVAADKVRFLSPEALAVIPKWEHSLRVGHVVTPAGREDVLITSEAVLPYGFIMEFLERSSYTRCEKIGNYSDTPGQRDFAQALTGELCRKGYAIPAHGNDPALWLTADSRSRFAREIGIELENGV